MRHVIFNDSYLLRIGHVLDKMLSKLIINYFDYGANKEPEAIFACCDKYDTLQKFKMCTQLNALLL